MRSIIMNRIEGLILTQMLTDEVIMAKDTSNQAVLVIVAMLMQH